MRPEISEFSYAYALVESIKRRLLPSFRAAPLFLSHFQEGKKGGGFDVALTYPSFLIFLQFKLSHYMVRKTAFEARQRLLPLPFYRMYLMPLKYSEQHNLLLDLESQYKLVFYAAPKFHLTTHLNDAYIKDEVIERSFFIRPKEIGPLPDDERHYVSFRDGSPVYLCSEPKIIREHEGKGSSFLEEISKFKKSEGKKPSREKYSKLSRGMLSILSKHERTKRRLTSREVEKLADREPLSVINHLAWSFFHCVVLGVE